MSKRNLLLFVVIVFVTVSAVPSWGAKFKGKTLSKISDSDFVKLCRTGREEEVIEAIQSRGANVNAKKQDGKTVLMERLYNELCK